MVASAAAKVQLAAKPEMATLLSTLQVLLKLRTSVEAKDGADKSSIVDNLRYESTGYNSVAEHFLGVLVSSLFAKLVSQLCDHHRQNLEEAEAVRADPTRRGAQLRALLAEKEAAKQSGVATAFKRGTAAGKRTAAAAGEKHKQPFSPSTNASSILQTCCCCHQVVSLTPLDRRGPSSGCRRARNPKKKKKKRKKQKETKKKRKVGRSSSSHNSRRDCGKRERKKRMPASPRQRSRKLPAAERRRQ